MLKISARRDGLQANGVAAGVMLTDAVVGLHLERQYRRQPYSRVYGAVSRIALSMHWRLPPGRIGESV